MLTFSGTSTVAFLYWYDFKGKDWIGLRLDFSFLGEQPWTSNVEASKAKMITSRGLGFSKWRQQS